MIENLDFYRPTIEDLVSIVKVIDVTDWGETEADIRRALRNKNNKYITLISREEGFMVGITLAVSYGNIGFIGHVVTLPKFRNMGLGQELMIEAINLLKVKGCRTIKLDAVKKTESLYKRVGFTFEINSLRFKYEINSQEDIQKLLDRLNSVEQQFPVFNIKEDNLSQIFEADKEIFGGNREDFLLSLFEEFPEYAFITQDIENYLAGYLFGTFQNGNLKLKAGISDSYNSTINLIKAALLTVKDSDDLKVISIGVLENSKWGIKAMEELGFKQTSFSLRMYFGEKSDASLNPVIFAIGDPAWG